MLAVALVSGHHVVILVGGVLCVCRHNRVEANHGDWHQLCDLQAWPSNGEMGSVWDVWDVTACVL